jgi:methionine synthase II (cobalamin-independent)
MVHYRGGRAALDERVYPDMEGFWSDLSAAYADELRALGELGCTYLQFDDTSLAYLNDPRQREQIAARGASDVEHLHEQYVRNINRALEGRPSKRGELESKDVLKRRIEEAARYVPIEQLCLSPQCGFSSTVEGNALTAHEQRAKLELIVETAAEVWG